MKRTTTLRLIRLRPKTRSQHIVYACLLMLVLCGCASVPSESVKSLEKTAPAVFVVNYPLQYFTERIGGDVVDVRFPAPADTDPAYWVPDAATLEAYQNASLIVLNGADYADWVSKVSLPPAKIVNTGMAVADRLIELEEHVTHAHGPEGEHAHGGLAFTTWLDPTLATDQAEAIKRALSMMMPDQEAGFEDRYLALNEDLLDLDREIEKVVSENGGQPIIFSHPVYQYLEKRYALNGRSVHWEPDQVPTREMWAELEAMLSELPSRWMVWEGEPLPETASRLKELGIQCVVFDPCSNRPDSGDYLSVMRQNVLNLQTAYSR